MESEGVFALIPVAGIVMGVGIGMLSIWAEHKRKSQLLEQIHRERMHAIEKGVEPPPLPENLIVEGSGPSTASALKAMRSGIMWLLIGIVLFIGLGKAAGNPGAALFGLIPAAVGVANLVYASVLWRQEKNGTAGRRA